MYMTHDYVAYNKNDEIAHGTPRTAPRPGPAER